MTEDEIRSLFDEWVQAFQAGDLELVGSLYAEDAVLYQAPVKKALVGRSHVLERLRYFNEMSDDGRFTVRALHVAGDTVIMEFNLTGTHTGRFLDYEPTGRKIDIDSCLVFVLKDGKIVKHTTYVDTATVLRALGLITIPGTRAEAA